MVTFASVFLMRKLRLWDARWQQAGRRSENRGPLHTWRNAALSSPGCAGWARTLSKHTFPRGLLRPAASYCPSSPQFIWVSVSSSVKQKWEHVLPRRRCENSSVYWHACLAFGARGYFCGYHLCPFITLFVKVSLLFPKLALLQINL